MPVGGERDKAVKKSNIGEEKRSAREVAVLIDLSELALLGKEKK